MDKFFCFYEFLSRLFSGVRVRDGVGDGCRVRVRDRASVRAR